MEDNPRDLVGRRTRTAVRELMSDTVLHDINTMWESEGFPPPSEIEPVGGQRVTRFEAYIRNVDWTAHHDAERALRVFQDALTNVFHFWDENQYRDGAITNFVDHRCISLVPSGGGFRRGRKALAVGASHIFHPSDVIIYMSKQRTACRFPRNVSLVDKGLKLLTSACLLTNSFEVIAKIRKERFVLANADEAGVPIKAIPYLAMIEGAGTTGLALGLAGCHRAGLMGALTLNAFFLGAVAAHVRARVFRNIVFPIAFLALSGGATALFVRSSRSR